MAFINDYLNEEEMEEFKRKAIPFRNDYDSGIILGYNENATKSFLSRVECTFDREEKIYLFYCGTEKYDFENIPKEHYFKLVWENEFGNDAISMTLENKYKNFSGKAEDVIICWDITYLSLNINNAGKKDKLISKLKEALAVYGFNGRPKSTIKYTIELGEKGDDRL